MSNTSINRAPLILAALVLVALIAAAGRGLWASTLRPNFPPNARYSLAEDAGALTASLNNLRMRLARVRELVPVPTDPAFVEKRKRQRARTLRSQMISAHGQQKALEDDHFDANQTMFISISSFRDLQCAPTIYDMYQKAKWPRNVFVGAVEQHEPGDPSCVPPQYETECDPARWCPSDNIMTRVIEPKAAKGPTFGRFYGFLMYRNEKYFMMIDSHNRWVTHWDDILLAMYRTLPTKKGVLAHYPEAWENPEDGNVTNAPLDNRASTMYMCTSHWLPDLGYVRMGGFIINRKAKVGKDMCRPQPYAGAGFVFARGEMVQEVPFDPHLNYVFDGEEITYTVRMWTHGWDIFSPSQNILFHYYYRTKAKKFWSYLPAGWEKQRDAAHRRIQFLLKTYKQNTTIRHVPDNTTEHGVLVDLDKYGLGTVRTVEEYYEYAGMDRVHYKLTKDWCAKYS